MKPTSGQWLGRKPDYRIAAKLGENMKGNVGGAWLDEQTGRISLRFNSFVSLPLHDPNLQLSLFPNTGEEAQ